MGAPRDGTGDVPGNGEVPGAWVSISEAARRCDVSRRAIRGRIERGAMTARDGNTGRMVFVPDGMVPRDRKNGSMGFPRGSDVGVPGNDPAVDLRRELDVERERRAAAEVRAAVAEREVTLLRERVDELGDLLKAAVSRGSWLERLARALRSPRGAVSGPAVGK